MLVADVSIVAKTSKGKPTPNPNVLIELGYALHAYGGTERIIMVFNEAHGDCDDVPFDLSKNRP